MQMICDTFFVVAIWGLDCFTVMEADVFAHRFGYLWLAIKVAVLDLVFGRLLCIDFNEKLKKKTRLDDLMYVSISVDGITSGNGYLLLIIVSSFNGIMNLPYTVCFNKYYLLTKQKMQNLVG